MKVSCGCYMDYDSLEDLFKIDFNDIPQPYFHMGGGSNLLFTKDFPGTVLHSGIKFLKKVGDGEDDVLVEAGAGVKFDDFVDWACTLGLWGAENLSNIPGEVGAAAVQNIGAYGVEAKDIILRVNAFDLIRREMVVIENKDCHYGYRTSVFKEEAKGRYIITSVLFRLTRVFSPKLDYGNIRAALQDCKAINPSDVRKAVTGIRNSKLPDPSEIGSAGSFFKNPVVSQEQFEHIVSVAGEGVEVPHFQVDGGIKVPAAWMIEKCGFKGASHGGAAVYEKQPLVIVNLSSDASPDDILALEGQVIEGVRDRFGVELHPEVEHI